VRREFLQEFSVSIRVLFCFCGSHVHCLLVSHKTGLQQLKSEFQKTMSAPIMDSDQGREGPEKRRGDSSGH